MSVILHDKTLVVSLWQWRKYIRQGLDLALCHVNNNNSRRYLNDWINEKNPNMRLNRVGGINFLRVGNSPKPINTTL